MTLSSKINIKLWSGELTPEIQNLEHTSFSKLSRKIFSLYKNIFVNAFKKLKPYAMARHTVLSLDKTYSRPFFMLDLAEIFGLILGLLSNFRRAPNISAKSNIKRALSKNCLNLTPCVIVIKNAKNMRTNTKSVHKPISLQKGYLYADTLGQF